jgi:hypothetical protein
MDKLRLFVLGESSGETEKWREGGWRALVIAVNAEEAVALFPEMDRATEVLMEKPGIIAVEPFPSKL